MADSIMQVTEGASGIPDAATRLTALVIIFFILGILMTLLYLRLKESEES